MTSPYQPPYPAPPRITSGVATAAFVLALIGVFAWCLAGLPNVLAVILGHAALKETRTGERGGHGLAVAALVLSYPFAVVWAWLVLTGTIGGVFG